MIYINGTLFGVDILPSLVHILHVLCLLISGDGPHCCFDERNKPARPWQVGGLFLCGYLERGRAKPTAPEWGAIGDAGDFEGDSTAARVVIRDAIGLTERTSLFSDFRYLLKMAAVLARGSAMAIWLICLYSASTK